MLTNICHQILFLFAIVITQFVAINAIDIKPESVPSLIGHSLLKNVRPILKEYVHVQQQNEAQKSQINLAQPAAAGLIVTISNCLNKIFDNSDECLTTEEHHLFNNNLDILEEIDSKFEQHILPENLEEFVESVKYIMPLMVHYEVRGVDDDHQLMLSGKKRPLELEIEMGRNSEENLSKILEEIKDGVENEIGTNGLLEHLKNEFGILSKFWKISDYKEIKNKIRSLNSLIIYAVMYSKFIDTLIENDKTKTFEFEFKWLREVVRKFVDLYFEYADKTWQEFGRDENNKIANIVADHFKESETMNVLSKKLKKYF